MCLSIAINRPGDVTGRGEHLGFEWITVHNGRGYRCGYVRVPPGHPWHGQGYDDVRAADGDYAAVHGGLTFSEADLDCDKGGPDDAWWLGFDCQHGHDLPDPSLPSDVGPNVLRELSNVFEVAGAFDNRNLIGGPKPRMWTQADVEAECRDLCRQAAEVASVPSA